MLHQLEFDELFHYDKAKEGIVVHVTLEFGDRKCDFDANVDTAATYSVFAREHGEQLGLEIEKGLEQRFGTALGVFTAYGHELYLEALGISFESYILFAADAGMTKNVLGRRGWLDKLRVGIIDYDSELYVSPYQAM